MAKSKLQEVPYHPQNAKKFVFYHNRFENEKKKEYHKKQAVLQIYNES